MQYLTPQVTPGVEALSARHYRRTFTLNDHHGLIDVGGREVDDCYSGEHEPAQDPLPQDARRHGEVDSVVDPERTLRIRCHHGLHAPAIPWYQQVTREQWRAFWAVFLGWVVDAFDFNILTFILIDIEKSFSVDRALAGLLGTVTLIMRLVGGTIAGTLADKWGRKPVTIAWFALALLFTPVLFLWTHDLSLLLVVCGINAVFSLGQYTWCPTWLPEVYPTRIRATAVVFCFNAPRFIAFLGQLAAGTLITYFGGYGRAAVMVSMIYILGIGVAPFPYLSAWLRSPPAVLGFRSDWHAEAASLLPNAQVCVEPRLVTELIPPDHAVLACGPEPMLEAVRRLVPAAQLAWEAPMACGYGACYGCAVEIDGQLRRLCVEGPVLAGNAAA